MAKVDFNEKVTSILKNKMLAVSCGEKFQIFHYPFKNDKEFDSLKEMGAEKKVALYLPVSQAQKNTNLWIFSGLSDVDVSKKKLIKRTPVRIGIPKSKLKNKWKGLWKESFIMKRAEVYNFCMKMASNDKMVVKVDRQYSIDNLARSMAKDMFAQFRERDYHDNKERKIDNLMQNRFLKHLANIDAIEVVRTTEEEPLFVSDGGAEIVQTKTGIPVAMPNEEGVINCLPACENYWESFKVVMYSFKDKEEKPAVYRMAALIKRNTDLSEEKENDTDLEQTK